MRCLTAFCARCPNRWRCAWPGSPKRGPTRGLGTAPRHPSVARAEALAERCADAEALAERCDAAGSSNPARSESKSDDERPRPLRVQRAAEEKQATGQPGRSRASGASPRRRVGGSRPSSGARAPWASGRASPARGLWRGARGAAPAAAAARTLPQRERLFCGRWPCAASHNSRLAERALQIFGRRAATDLLLGPAHGDCTVAALFPALWRGGKSHWSATVNKMRARALSMFLDVRPEAVQGGRGEGVPAPVLGVVQDLAPHFVRPARRRRRRGRRRGDNDGLVCLPAQDVVAPVVALAGGGAPRRGAGELLPRGGGGGGSPPALFPRRACWRSNTSVSTTSCGATTWARIVLDGPVREADRQGQAAVPLAGVGRQVVRRELMLCAETQEAVQREMACFSIGWHPNCCGIAAAFVFRAAHLVFSTAPGAISTRSSHEVLSEASRFLLAEIVEALEAVHAAGIAYGDLKPENVMLRASGHAMLCDLGARDLPKPDRTGPNP